MKHGRLFLLMSFLTLLCVNALNAHWSEIECCKTLRVDDNPSIPVIAFSPDGTCLALVCGDGAIVLLNIKTGDRVTTLINHEEEQKPISTLAFDPEGRFLYSSSAYDGNPFADAKLWNLNDGTCSDDCELEPEWPVSSSLYAYSPKSKYAAMITEEAGGKAIEIVDEDESPIATLKEDKSTFSSIAFSCDGQYLVSGLEDGLIRLWSVNGEHLTLFEAHEGNISAVAFSRDGRKLASVSGGTIKIWDLIA